MESVRSSYHIPKLAEVNRPGVRIAGVDGTATFRASTKASPNATSISVKSPDIALDLMRTGKADAIALSRETIVGLLAVVPGSRALDGGFLNSTTAVAYSFALHLNMTSSCQITAGVRTRLWVDTM